MILKSLKKFLNGVIKEVPWPAALLKRDSNKGSTVMVLQSLKKFLNHVTKNIP